MKKAILIFTIALAFSNLNIQSSAAKTSVDRIDPTDWYVGMKDASLQLMIYGENINTASDVTTDYEGVRIDSIVHLESPNYLLVYLDLTGAKAGDMTLTFSFGKKKKTAVYTLKEREKAGEERYGFTSADVLYMLMPDRFAQGKDPEVLKKQLAELKTPLKSYTVDRSEPSLRHGGDLEGIRQHITYFVDLGVTALWFTPVLENNSPDDDVNKQSTYHGYATTDYYRVDPRFGTNEEYRQLIDEAHKWKLKVVMDMIFNHCGFDHPWVADMPSADWFNAPEWLANNDSAKVNDQYLQTSYKLTPVVDPYASQFDLNETVSGWFVPSMPDLNQKNPHVIKYLVQNSMWWIETVGIDGIRMDTYPYADAEAMAQWMKAIDNEYPNFNTVGETWVTEPAYTASWQKGSKVSPNGNSYLKTVMDFSFYDKINQAKNERTDAWWEGFNRIYNSFVYDYLYPNPSSVMAFIENHDTDRFLGNGCDTLALKQALALLLTCNRIPQLYYGTEVLMNGTKEVTDGNVRKDFPGGFPDDEHSAFSAKSRNAKENYMYRWLTRLLHWRLENETLHKGAQIQFIPYNGIYVLCRHLNGHYILLVLNGTDEEAVLDVSRYAEVIYDVLGEDSDRVKDITTNRYYNLLNDVKMKPRQTAIFEYNKYVPLQ